VVHDEWVPVSPKTGRFDALVWSVPAEPAGSRAPEAVPAPATALIVSESDAAALAPPGTRQ
jgi:uncharacterized membrane-anchored protein